ncbi:amino acid adenylation domain-containing protein [Mucilaginibacter sp.]|uniref:amino acid adenylation domain-containing protein n=1 Tax=Mucilaginibacter sp. TaxID=1882438 RepID=UPI000CAB9BA4|nr:amino acid adenylation domain-containing protein [Mucilaginibacter sp.]PLW90691.1 MAG: thioester reductase [Mucilaginibacter sp.]PMP65552.1 MAG: thioester reductase [Mucilaginibacter sp.]HEK22320.1 amino acid adenylation domain-containing protein [Bacteroidota bacterium]
MEYVVNNTNLLYPKEKTLFELFTESVTKYPDNTALTFHHVSYTYTELNQTVNRLTRELLKQGAGKGVVIGLALDRCAEMVVSLLAILKSGSIYVPLDPEYPKDRIEFMLDDSSARILLTSQKYKGHFASNTREILIEDALVASKDHPADEPEKTVTGADLAYILYTSGSTGKPKGVQIAHHSLVNVMLSLQKQPGIKPGERMLAVATISFDIAGVDLYLPLSSGAEIVLADSITAKDGRALLDIVRTQNINILQATPYTWRMMLEVGWDEYLPLTVFTGGEALAKDLAERLIPRSKAVWNMYGPTETTIYSIIKHITDANDITIGWPVANTQVYILDEEKNNLTNGEIGEIYIGGDGVARGYLNRPELNAERFIDNPFTPGEKIYRTGDLAKIKPDGDIVYLGRIDHQVKVRGYRIELGEIEHNLGKQEGIKQAVVIAREDTPGIPRLVAYLVLESGQIGIPDKTDLDKWDKALLDVLPEYMVPDDYVLLDVIPSTPNGKIDRKALPKPDYSHINRDGEYLAPRTSNEQLVAGIWEDMMGLEKVSIFDNFFQLGGRSLVAVKIMARLEQETGKRLPLATLFEYSTVEKLASRLEIDAEAITWESLVPIKPRGSKMPLYIVHGAGLNVLLFNALAMNMDDEQPVYGLQAKGLNGIDEPLDVMEEIAANYVDEIINHDPVGPYAVAGYSLGGLIAYEMAKQMLAMGKDVKMLAMFDTYADQTQKFDSPLKRFVDNAWLLVKQIAYTPVLFAQDPARTIEYKSREIGRRIKKLFKNVLPADKKEGFSAYTDDIHERSLAAQKNYLLTPVNIAIELFRAKKKTFYMNDFKYLGWKPFALKGVHVHDIPGEHNTIFAPPNDKEFAQVLQKCLDEAAAGKSSKG